MQYDRSYRLTKKKQKSRSPLRPAHHAQTNNDLLSLRQTKATFPKSSNHSHNSSLSKENGSEKLYQLQNEIDIDRIKNAEMHEHIKRLQLEHLKYLEQAKDLELDCADLETEIGKQKVPAENKLLSARDRLAQQARALEIEYRSWTDRVTLIVQNIFRQEGMLKQLAENKQQAEMDLWKVKMENEGMKVVVAKLEKDIDQLRTANEELIKKRKVYGPEEEKIAADIQERVREIKEKTRIGDQMIRSLTGICLAKCLGRLYHSKMSLYCIDIRKNADLISSRKKTLFRVMHIAKGFQKYIKHKYLSKFRGVLEPSKEQSRVEQVLRKLHALKKKNSYFAIWRKQFIKSQYSMIRKLEVLSSLDKIQASYRDGLLSQAFNRLQSYKLSERNSIDRLFQILSRARSNQCNLFLAQLKRKAEYKYLDEQIEMGSKYQTEFLIKSLYFNALTSYIRNKKPENRAILYKYFHVLKRNRTNKKKRELNEVLGLLSEKNNMSELMLKSFCAFKYVAIQQQKDNKIKEKESIQGQVKEMKQDLETFVHKKKGTFKELAMLKLSSLLHRSTKKAFYKWRRWNQARSKFLDVLEMLHSKSFNDKNLGFAKIMSRRFYKLKLSIADKIKSCEFSYNYLTEENAHIKEVLDRKTLQVEKTKFIKVIKALILNQKAIMKKYFLKFMVRGEKVWGVKTVSRRLEALINKLIKQEFMFVLKTRNTEIRSEIKKEHSVSIMQSRYEKSLLIKSLKTFHENYRKSKNMKSVLIGVFSRNLELAYHRSFLLLKNIYNRIQFTEGKSSFHDDSGMLKNINESIDTKERSIVQLKDTLKTRNDTMKDRLVVSAKLFLTRWTKKHVMTYVGRWRNRVKHDKGLMRFTVFLETKMRTTMTEGGFNKLYKWFLYSDKEDLDRKYEKFTDEFDQANDEYNNLAKNVDDKIRNMNAENDRNTEIAKDYKNRMRAFDKVKINNFQRAWGKMFSRAFVTKWKQYVEKERVILENMIGRFNIIGEKIGFEVLAREIKQEMVRERAKKNLEEIYHKGYLFNVNELFQVWRNNANKATTAIKARRLQQSLTKQSQIEDQLDKRVKLFEGMATKQFVQSDTRKYFYALRTITRIKRAAKVKGRDLQKLLKNRQGNTFMKLLQRKTKKSIILTKRKAEFDKKRALKRQRALLNCVTQDKLRRSIFKDKFLGVFITRLVKDCYARGLANIKKYGRSKDLYMLNKNTFRTQKMIETFNKVVKMQLGKVWRSWRKSEFIRDMKINMLRRLVRRAMNNRVEKLFNAWKLQASARSVLVFHNSEGQVKKREREYQRTKRYIEEFKKSKGLLLENEEGHLVLSPRFLEKKEVQEKTENTNRYKLVARLLLVANGEQNTIKAWNNLRLYRLMRDKIKKHARLCRNYLKNPEQTWAFKRWHQVLKHTREQFDSMPRKELIKILQKQKDKIEMEYSKKLNNEQHMNSEIKRFEILERQSDIREKLCGLVIIRAMRGKKESAFHKWRQLVKSEDEGAANQLENNGDMKLSKLERELMQLQDQYHAAIAANRDLKETAMEGLDIAEAVRKLTLERDELNKQLIEKALSCEALLQENTNLTNKYKLASQEAMQLLSLTKNT